MLPIYSNLSINGQVELGNAIGVSTTGTLNNLANTDSSIIRVTSATAVIITGLVAPTQYKVLNIIHQGAGSLTITHQGASSDAPNRIITASGADIALTAGQVVTLIYDPIATRWVVVSVSVTSSGGGGGGSGVSQTINTAPVGLLLGMPVYWDGTKYAPARSNNRSTLASAIVSVLNAGDYTVQFGGTLTLTNAQWDAVTGGSGGLSIATSSNKYYLSDATAGRFVTYIPPLMQSLLIGIGNSGGSSTAEVKFGVQALESGQGDTILRNQFTGNGVQTAFTLDSAPAGIDYTTVHIGGVYQIPNDSYTLSGATITFSSAPVNTAIISITYARAMLLADVNAVNRMVSFSETVSGSPKNTFNLATTPAGVNSVILFIGGSIQDTSQFTLSGNVLTTLSSVGVGVQVIAYVLNSTGVSNSIDTSITRIAYALADNTTASISTIFGSQVSGVYRFHDSDDPRINGVIGLQHTGNFSDPNVSVDTSNTFISTTFDTASSLNWFISSNVLQVQNKLGRTVNLKIFREV
jgi:hypothetical protein